MNRWLSVCALSSALLALAAQGGVADSLYGEAAPRDAAYVRFFVAGNSSLHDPLEIGGTRFVAVAPGSATPYRPVAPDIYLVDNDGRRAEIIPKKERYYTIAILPAEIRVFEDVAHTDPARAQIVLYNVSALDWVGLRTSDGRVEVMPAVARNRSHAVRVNAVPVRLTVAGPGSFASQLADPGLRRGASHSVFVYGQGEETVAAVVEASLEMD
jgi:hypothetical protein